MFKLFKKTLTNEIVIAEPKADLRVKTINEVVEEIHETFYTEVDKLLESAKITNSLDTDKQHLIDKCARLKALGFIKTKEVKEAEVEIARLNKLKRDNENKKDLIDAINYFSFKYPNYKFINYSSVVKICKKYNLFCGAIDSYIGTVPDKNLKHIENFRILEDDECYIYKELYESGYIRHFIYYNKQTKDYSLQKIKEINDDDYYQPTLTEKVNEKCPLEIVAPLKDFDMTGMEINGYNISKVEIPDPIVLKPVYFNDQKYYLIVTAWGVEASDELVVNANHN